MPYNLSLPPSRITEFPLSGPGAHWFYTTSDTAATVDTAGYISNGGDLGMKVGDLVFVNVTGTGVVTTHRVASVASASPGATDLGDGTTIGSATNTD